MNFNFKVQKSEKVKRGVLTPLSPSPLPCPSPSPSIYMVAGRKSYQKPPLSLFPPLLKNPATPLFPPLFLFFFPFNKEVSKKNKSKKNQSTTFNFSKKKKKKKKRSSRHFLNLQIFISLPILKPAFLNTS